MASRKVDFSLKVEEAATQFAAAFEQLEMLRESYFNSGYNSGGSDELLDSDITDHDVNVAKITNIMTLIENQTKFMDDQVPTSGDYRASLGAIRKF